MNGGPDSNTSSMAPGYRTEVRNWARLALGALGLAGILALMLAFSRTPGVKAVLWEHFFYQSLITHVVFSVVVWYLAVLGVLSVMATARGVETLSGARPLHALGRPAVWLAMLSFALLLAPAVLNLGPPLINNYVPTIVHPVFYIGLGLLAVATALVVLRNLVTFAEMSKGARGGFDILIAVLGAVYLVALLCFGWAWGLLPSDLDVSTYNERLFWGGGHVLQFVNTGLAIYAWAVLCKHVTGEDALDPGLFRAVAVSLLVMVLPAPLFYAFFGVLSLEHRNAFTELLWYGLSLPAAVMLIGVAATVWSRRAVVDWKAPATWALVLSFLVFSGGGILGYFLGVSDTRTPAHYHAIIGGVNLPLYALFFLYVLPTLAWPGVKKPRTLKILYVTVALGQVLQSAGLFWAGAAGVPRKTAGAAQGLDSLEKKMAMGLNGMGGLVAIIGGIMFIWIVGRFVFKRGGEKQV